MRPEAPPSLPPLGAHVSVAGGMPSSIDRAIALECTAIQVFVKNASQWQGKVLADEEVAAFRSAHAASPVGPLVAHASYLINLCSTDPALLERSRQALADELMRCQRLGVHGLVLHPGAHVGAGEDAGIERVAASLDAVFAGLKGVETRLLLENTAGQGSCLGYRLDHLARIRQASAARERIGVCLDTCHAFAAGYAVHEEAGYREFFAEAEEVLGLATIGAFHLNDSVKPFGSRRDRHAHIGEGEIGLDLFARLLGDERLRSIPMILETEPGDDMEGHRKDLAVLRGLAEPVAGRKGRPARARATKRGR